jgi:hypothetical protein
MKWIPKLTYMGEGKFAIRTHIFPSKYLDLSNTIYSWTKNSEFFRIGKFDYIRKDHLMKMFDKFMDEQQEKGNITIHIKDHE